MFTVVRVVLGLWVIFIICLTSKFFPQFSITFIIENNCYFKSPLKGEI